MGCNRPEVGCDGGEEGVDDVACCCWTAVEVVEVETDGCGCLDCCSEEEMLGGEAVWREKAVKKLARKKEEVRCVGRLLGVEAGILGGCRRR
jgi:hypothetical protein